MVRCLLSLLVLLLLPGFGLAQGLGWQVSPTQPQVGDRVQATLALLHADTVAPDWASLDLVFDGGEVDPEIVTESVADGEGKTRSWRTYTVYVDLPGELTLPQLVLPVGGDSLSVAAMRVPIQGGFDPDNPPPLAAAKGPLAVAAPWWPYGLAGGALLALLAGLWWWLRRPKAVAPKVAAPVVPARPAHLVALEQLDRLDLSLPPRHFFGELSTITCGYIAARHGIFAPAMSREEILRAITQHTGQHGHELSPVASWLDGWELFKFARVTPEVGRHRADLEAVRAWVVASSAESPSRVGDANVAVNEGKS